MSYKAEYNYIMEQTDFESVDEIRRVNEQQKVLQLARIADEIHKHNLLMDKLIWEVGKRR